MPHPHLAVEMPRRVHAASSAVAPPRAAAIDAGWDPLLVSLVVYLLTAIGRLHQLFPLLSPLHPALLSAACAVVFYLLLPSGSPWRRTGLLPRSRPLLWMGAFLLWATLSVPGALWVGGAFRTVTDVLVKSVLMAAVLVGAVRGVRDVERLAGGYFAAIAVYAGIVLTRFRVGGDAWRLGDLYYYDANDFATLAVTALPLGIYFALRARSLAARAAAGLGLACITTAFIWAGSRGGFVALLAVALFLVLGYTSIPLRWRLSVTVGLGLLFAATASDAFWAKMGTLLHPANDYNLESPEGRSAIWKRGIGYLLSHPVLGVGAGNFPTAEGTISPRAARQSVGRGVKWQAAHNSYVQVGAELGFPGLACFLGMIGSAYAGLRRRWRRPARAAPHGDPRTAPLAQALGASLVGFTVGAFFLSLAYTEALYVLVALASGLRRSPTW